MKKIKGESLSGNLFKKMIPITKAMVLVITIYILVLSNQLFAQWNQVNTLSNIGSFPSISMVTDNIFFVAGGPSGTPVIYKTTNGGVNFTAVNTVGITLELYSIWAVDVNTIYVGDGGSAGGNGGNAKVYKTTNGGTNWTNILSTGGTNGFINGIVFSRSNPQIGIIQSDPPTGTGRAFWLAKTTNGGVSWTVSAPGGVSGNLSAQNSVFLIDANFYGFGLNLSPQIRYTTNGGTNWLTRTLTGAQGQTGFVTSIAFNNNKLNGVAAGYGTYNSISRTTNGGLNWFAQAIPSTIPNGNNFGELKWIPGFNTVYLVVSSSSATQSFKSEDNGATWVQIPFPGTGGVTHMDAAYFASNSQLSSPASSGPVYKLTDSPMPVDLISFTYNIKVRDINLKWTTSFEENNYGFQIERMDMTSNPVIIRYDIIGFVKGIGNTNNSHEYNYSDSKLNCGKYDYRIKQIDYNGEYKYYYLDKIISIDIPTDIKLSQNYPNPFNPVTKIDYELPQASDVVIKLYDMSGREVIKLINGTQSAGYHTLQFDGSNLASGMYFYKLFTRMNDKEIVLTKKMNIIK